MSKCKYCNKEMLSKKTITCTHPYLKGQKKKFYKRDTTYFDGLHVRCMDCHILNKEGNIHHFGCEVEKCPICGGQLVYCDCDIELDAVEKEK